MLISKHFDPVLGIDIHILIIPPAGPVPIPHPHISLIFDVIDYIPILGATVKVGGLPRSTAGSSGRPIPHFPMGGPFAKPPMNEDEILMGSTTVLADGGPLSFTALPMLSCQDIGIIAPPRKKKPKKSFGMLLPTSVVISIPLGMPVMVGGPPTIDMMGLLMAGGFAALGGAFKKLRKMQKKSKRIKKMSDAIHSRAKKAMNKLGVPPNVQNKVHKGICTVTGHPVDVASGKMFTDHIDFSLPGPLPLVWERTWYSTSVYDGPLGHGWHHSYDVKLCEMDNAVAVRLADGRSVAFPALDINESCFDRQERLTLFRDEEGYALDTSDKKRYRFAPFQGQADNQLLTTLSQTTSGAKIEFFYNDKAQLTQIIDSGGRLIRFSFTNDNRIHQIFLPEPESNITRDHTNPTFFCAVEHHYRDGILVRVDDALQQSLQYQYDHKLLIKETFRSGLSFYFQYDALDHNARCVRTWGDGDIYLRDLHYDDENKITQVRDSRGNITVYHHDGVLPYKIIDPLNNINLIEYNEYSQIICETNPLGFKTQYKYDERGNRVAVLSADGTVVKIQFDEHDNLIEVVDKIGSKWKSEYYDNNQLATKIDPLNNKLRYEYHHGLLSVIEDNSGPIFFKYDQNFNLRSVSDGGIEQFIHEYDALGNLLTSKDNRGNERHYYYDKLQRITRVDEPDGTIRVFAYDAGDNIIRARDQQRDVSMEYRGMGRMVARTQHGATVKFEYDHEEQLISIINEHGCAYRFELNANEELISESSFDGLVRHFSRDSCGQVTSVLHSHSKTSQYSYDSMSRVTQILHSDGTYQSYSYRSDGELVSTTNNYSAIKFDRDIFGNIVKEIHGEFWVSSEYDTLGYRTRVQSSFGLDQKIERNSRGDALKVSTGADQFEAVFQRDKQGLEIQRSLPGGIQSRWARDKLGRPTCHEVHQGKKIHNSKTYLWGLNNRLLKLVDSLNRETVFQHDALGNLFSARYSDSMFDLRMPDAVGNLFKTMPQKDREYGTAGQLLAVHSNRGTTRYLYDIEGNLIRKIEPKDKVWHYEWNGAGMMSKVIRPDGKEIIFEYDALGRRIRKVLGNKITCWLWDGNNPLHEWVEYKAGTGNINSQPLAKLQAEADDISINQRLALLQQIDSQGPPKLFSQGTKDAPITWLFEPDGFAPMAKLVGDEHYSIITDHIGTPNIIFDKDGTQVWSADISVWGELRNLRGDKDFCPFRFPGQYEDSETGLYYNRFRYFDPETGQYVSKDPINLAGGKLNVYSYVNDSTQLFDALGLKACFENEDAEKFAEGIIKKHGGTKIKDGHYKMPNRRAARKAASEIAGDLGSEVTTVRKKDYLGGPRTWKNSEGKIGKQNKKKSAGWRDDSPGHDFGNGDVIGSHVNAWNTPKGVNTNLHLLY